MLVVNRADQTWHDSLFSSFPDHLRANDVLVLNNTRVFPARLIGRRAPTGGSVEILLLREQALGVWQVLARPARRLRVGAQVVAANDDGTRVISFSQTQNLQELIDEIGEAPLPPYIKRATSADNDDRE